jgi:hypothetical protein
MATRTSPLPLLAVLALVVVLGALAVLMLDDAPAPPDDGGTPIVLPDEEPAVVEPDVPEPVESRPPPKPAEPPPVRTGGLTGRILDRNRVSVQGAEVSLHRGLSGLMGASLHDLGHTVSTDGQGRFRFEELDEETRIVVRVTGQGFEATESGPHSVFAREVNDIGSIVVSPGVTVAGVVLDESSRRIPGASVRLESGSAPAFGEPEASPLRQTTTDENGLFSLEHAPGPPFIVTVSADGYARGGVVHGSAGEALKELYEVTIRLTAGARFRGRVLAGEDDHPLPGVDVRVQSSSQGNAARSYTVTDDEGRFEVDDMPRGRVIVLADSPDRVEGRMTIEEAQFDDEATLRLKPTFAIEGRVVDPDDRAVGAFDIQARVSNRHGAVGEPAGPVRRVMDRSGRFRLESLEPGWYVLEVWARDFAVTLSPIVRLKPARDTTGVSVVLQPPAALLGRVVDDAGAPVAGARVSLHTNDTPTIDFLRATASEASWLINTRTDEAGYFELGNATEGSYQLEVDHSDYPLHWQNDVTVRAGEREDLGELVLPRPAVVEGTLIDPSGQVMTNATVFLTGGPRGSISRRSTSDGKGRYHFDRLPPGGYFLHAEAPSANPIDRIAAKLAKIDKNAEDGVYLAPDLVLQAGDVVEHLLRAGS